MRKEKEGGLALLTMLHIIYVISQWLKFMLFPGRLKLQDVSDALSYVSYIINMHMHIYFLFCTAISYFIETIITCFLQIFHDLETCKQHFCPIKTCD